jgi:hypothetical protein
MRRPSLWSSLSLYLAILVMPSGASADHCKWRYAEGFQRVTNRPIAGLSQPQISKLVEDLFGPRQPVCEEAAYRFFLSQFKTYATAAFRKKGAEREAMLIAAQEILKRVPSQVFYKNTQDKVSAYKQLRSDLGVIATEVGGGPSIQTVLDAVDRLGPPAVSTKPEPMSDDAVQIKVPDAPLPPWAVISLYEIHDHAQRKQHGAVVAKSALILEWMKLVTSGTRPEDIKVVPTPAPAPH